MKLEGDNAPLTLKARLSYLNSIWIPRVRSYLPSWGVFSLLFLCIWGFVAFTRIGITPDEAYWNESGVPILGLQVILSLLISVTIFEVLPMLSIPIHDTYDKNRITRFFIPLLIWIIAVGVWMMEPQRQSFNAPRPSPPTYEYYPFSDSTSYDLGSQFALIGQGINNNLLTDKPLYMLFLALLHSLGGQSVRIVIGLQVLVLAFFPVVLYFLGMDLHSRGAGVFIGLLSIFKERNAIASAIDIQVSHLKLMMTEVPTALIISLATLMMVRWMMKMKVEVKSSPIIVGGVLGAALLLRANSFFLLPLALLLPYVFGGKNLRRSLISSGLVFISFLLVVSPWMIFNRDQDGRTFIEVKLNNVFERYEQSLPEGSGGSSTQKVDAKNQVAMVSLSLEGDTDERRFESGDDVSPLVFIAAHFFHNQIASIFILPVSARHQNLSQTLESPIWGKEWTGSLTIENRIMLFINLILIALGISAAWTRWKLIGLIPFLVELLYFFANALARTSGSRYLVPVDWVVYFYYGIGLFQIASWSLKLIIRNENALVNDGAVFPKNETYLASIIPFLSFLLLGLSMPFTTAVVPQRYPERIKTEAYRELRSIVSKEDFGFPRETVGNFLKDPDSVVLLGRLLYPRYFLANEGLCTKCYVLDTASMDRPYPRLTFIVLGQISAGVVVEMIELPENFRKLDLSDGPDVWVLGCKNHDQVIGLFKDFHSSVRGLLIAIPMNDVLQVFTPPGLELDCD